MEEKLKEKKRQEFLTKGRLSKSFFDTAPDDSTAGAHGFVREEQYNFLFHFPKEFALSQRKQDEGMILAAGAVKDIPTRKQTGEIVDLRTCSAESAATASNAV